MTRIILISAIAALLAACSTGTPDQFASARRACADVGIGPGDPASAQCAVNLDTSLWDEQQFDH